MKKKPPLPHPYDVVLDELISLKNQLVRLFDYLFIPFPSCYWHYFMIVEFFLVCRFALATAWTKPTKIESDFWHEYKYDLLYVSFLVEFLFFSLCFFVPHRVSFVFLAVWLALIFFLWGAFDSAVVEYWRLRFYFLFYFSCWFGWFFSVFLWAGVFFLLYCFMQLFFFNSFVLFSMFFFFFRMADFFVYRWLGRYWPLFNDVDSAEFFNLFDSYVLSGGGVGGTVPYYNAMFTQDNFDLISVAPNPILVASRILDNPLHDTPGIGGGLGADKVSKRDKEDDEDLMWYADLFEQYLYGFHQELPMEWDRPLMNKGLATLAWAHTEKHVLPCRKRAEKPSLRDRRLVDVPELLTVEYDWEWDVISYPLHKKIQSHLVPFYELRELTDKQK
jgi:hypothetical protein